MRNQTSSTKSTSRKQSDATPARSKQTATRNNSTATRKHSSRS